MLTRNTGIFVGNADGSILLATHPVIASEFNDLKNSSWLMTSFALAGASTMALVRTVRRMRDGVRANTCCHKVWQVERYLWAEDPRHHCLCHLCCWVVSLPVQLGTPDSNMVEFKANGDPIAPWCKSRLLSKKMRVNTTLTRGIAAWARPCGRSSSAGSSRVSEPREWPASSPS